MALWDDLINTYKNTDLEALFSKRSIGIEHEADLSHTDFTTAMEKASIALIKYLMQQYNISVNRVLPHRSDWGGATSTSCPNLSWSSESNFNTWKQSNL